MTQEEKQLLLKDLSARLPYGVKCRQHKLDSQVCTMRPEYLKNAEDAEEYEPYLRPLSSMTTEEWIEYCDCCLEDEKDEIIIKQTGYRIIPTTHREHFFNSHHFDYRGLIPMGLALEAPDGMYNKEESEKGGEIPIPKTVDEAVKTLAKIVSKEDRDYLLENGAISMHDSMGRWIRNEWGLWTGSELKNELEKKGFEHPDDMSNYIIEEFIKYCLEKI